MWFNIKEHLLQHKIKIHAINNININYYTIRCFEEMLYYGYSYYTNLLGGELLHFFMDFVKS